MKKSIIIVSIVALLIILLGTTGAIVYNSTTNNNNKDNKQKDDKVEQDLQSIMKEKALLVYNYINYAGAYCSDGNNYNDLYDTIKDNQGNSYYASKQFTNYEDMIKFLKNNLSDEVINKRNITNKEFYIEKNGKLYCNTLGKGSMYEYNLSNIKLNVLDNNRVSVIAIIEKIDPDKNKKNDTFNMLVEKVNNNWIVKSFNQ